LENRRELKCALIGDHDISLVYGGVIYEVPEGMENPNTTLYRCMRCGRLTDHTHSFISYASDLKTITQHSTSGNYSNTNVWVSEIHILRRPNEG